MEKALEILKQVKELSGWIKCGAELPLDKDLDEAIEELEEAMKPKSCEGCWYGKTTINSVICGKNGTYKEADDYCKYYNPKEQ